MREPCEQCGRCTACDHYPAYVEGFPARVRLAAQCIRTGNGLFSRAFDNCFEMSDGDVVAVAIDRLAAHDPVLRAGMARVWDNAESRVLLQATLARFAAVPDARLANAARQEREQSCDAYQRARQPVAIVQLSLF